MAFKMFDWVPDGVYDSLHHQVRYHVVDGNPYIVITKMWLDTGGPRDVLSSLRLPWGTYPDMPSKHAK